MQDILGSVRRSLVFRPSQMADGGGAGAGGSARIAEKIGSCIRKSRVGLGLALGIFPKGSPSDPPEDSPPAIRWRKGELIGCGAFGRVYMGMNLDSGELLAIKQVLIGPNNASREKAQAHICELEEEVKLLRNLSHSNIVRYLGTAREEETLNILMEFVPGGSISSLLGKFGSFPEAVIRMYTKQLLLGLEYLHKNGIMHRDIKGANILVDNKGCIKLADFGASKQVAELATMTAAKSMKGTPYWMAPEVILRTGHSFSADIWSVGCTVIEMATGKPPWSEQFQEVAALYHVGSTKSHPPIPEQLSANAKDFLLKCLQKEPSLRSSASDLLQHPFVTGENKGKGPVPHTSTGACETVDAEEGLVSCSTVRPIPACGPSMIDDFSCESTEKLFNARPMWEACMDDDMCELGEGDDLQKSFNPMSEPLDDWPCKLDMSSHEEKDFPEGTDASNAEESTFTKVENDFTFPCLPCEDDDDDELTESKIRAFLDEKALDLKKLQTPLYEFYNTLNSSNYPSGVTNATEEKGLNILKRPPRSKLSPSRMLSNVSPTQRDASPIQKPDTASTSCSQNLRPSVSGGENRRILREIPSPKFTENGALQDSRKDLTLSQSLKMKWEEELAEELARGREMLRQGLLGFPSPAK